MKAVFVIVGIFLAACLCFLHKWSVNKAEWYSSFKYPNEKGDYLIQDYQTNKYEVATYDNGWYFKGAKPNNFKWRKLDS